MITIQLPKCPNCGSRNFTDIYDYLYERGQTARGCADPIFYCYDCKQYPSTSPNDAAAVLKDPNATEHAKEFAKFLLFHSDDIVRVECPAVRQESE